MSDYNVGITIDISEVSTDTDSDYGLTSGIFYWVTGRPGYSGSGYSGDAPAGKTWKEGFIIDLKSIQPSTDIIDTQIAGNYAAISGFKFDLLNVGQFFNEVDTNEWWMLGKTVNVYVFIDDVSYQRWSGVVSGIDYNETRYSISCRGNYETKHKNFPPQAVTDSLFPFLDENVEGDIIPVCIGDINKAKCLPVYTEYVPIEIAIFDGVSYKVASLSFASETTNEIVLYTGGLSIAENQYKGYVVRAVVGGNSQTATIESNGENGTIGIQKNWRTSFILEKWFDTPPTSENKVSTDIDSPEIWYFEISKYSTSNIVSNGPIESFYSDDYGNPIDVSYWDDDAKKYVPISNKALDYDKSDIRSTGFPGLSMKSRGTDIDTDYFDKFTMSPTEVNPINPINGASNPTYLFGTQVSTDLTFNDDNPNLRDRDQSTSNEIVSNGGTPINVLNYSVYFDCKIPTDLFERDYQESYLLFDGAIESSTNQLFEIEVGYILLDGRDRETEELNTTTIFSQSLTASTEVDLNYIPKQYYGESPDDETFNTYRGDLDLSEYISNSKSLNAYNRIRMRIKVFSSVGFGASDTCTFTLKDFAFVGVDEVNLKNQAVFTKVAGEQDEGTVSRTPAIAYTRILEGYDGISDTDIDYTGITYDWHIGRQITEQKNSKEYLMNLSKHTYTGMFWDREGKLILKSFLDDTTSVGTFDESNIIKGSIKTFRDVSPDKVYNDIMLYYDWDEGRQKFNKTIGITNTDQTAFPATTDSTETNADRSANFTQLTVHYEGSDGFWSGTIDYSSSITSWASEGVTISWDDGAGNIILFAEITFVYGSGTAAGIKFQNLYGVSVGSYTGVDTLKQNGSSIQKWKTYAIGISDYAMGKEWWELCHSSYLRTKKVNTLPKEYSELKWFQTPGNFGTSYYDSAYLYMQLLIERVTVPRKYTEFDIPIDSDTLQYNLLDYHGFSDVFYTNAATFYGWIQKIKTNYSNHTITIGTLLEPTGVTTDDTIIETTTASTIYTETTSASTIITEGA